MPLVVLDQISHAYGHLPLLDKAALQVEPGERIAIIGRNGTGKSTLMQIIGGELPPARRGVSIPQEPALPLSSALITHHSSLVFGPWPLKLT